MKKLILILINFIIKKSDNKNSLNFLAIFSFLESIIIPIPPDILLIPITLTKRYKWLFLGLFTTFFSILGGIVGYIIGMFFWDIIGIKIVNFYDAHHHIDYIKGLFDKYGWAVILIAGFSPIPYKVFTIGSGLLGYNFMIFLLCSFISRGLRFVSLTFLISKYGHNGLKLVEKHFFKFTLAISLIVVTIIFLIYNL